MNKKSIILIGDKESKRFMFYDKAMNKNIHSFIAMDWESLDVELLKEADLVKIEPPTIKESTVDYLNEFVEWYYKKLEFLGDIEGVNYLNNPKGIMECLDKVESKKALIKNGVLSTELLGYGVNNYEKFIGLIDSKNIHEVFIKPRFGSGACGIVVYRRNPRSKQEIIYTTSSLGNNGEIQNHKSIIKENNSVKIKSLIDAICSGDVIVEKWEKKARYKNFVYDLRVVYQFGKIEYIVARGSSGPITNLHLNNNPIEFEVLGFNSDDVERINKVCSETMACFTGLNVAGIDILVTPSREFKVIEVNSQGDLIYADVYNENVIYRNQVEKFLR